MLVELCLMFGISFGFNPYNLINIFLTIGKNDLSCGVENQISNLKIDNTGLYKLSYYVHVWQNITSLILFENMFLSSIMNNSSCELYHFLQMHTFHL